MNNKTQDSLFARINSQREQLNQMEAILEAMHSAMDNMENGIEKFQKSLPKQKQESTNGHVYGNWTEKDHEEVVEISNRLAEKRYGDKKS